MTKCQMNGADGGAESGGGGFGVGSAHFTSSTSGHSVAAHETKRLHAKFNDVAAQHPTGLCHAICRMLVEETGMEIAMVTRFVVFEGERPVRARVTACEGLPGYEVGSEYDLAGTPCEHTELFCFGCVPNGVPERYPTDISLIEMGIESYAGAALTGLEGHSLGSVLTMSREPLKDTERAMRALVIVAQRSAIEIERRRKEAALHARERRYHALVEAMPDGLVVYQDGAIVYANPHAARLRGVDRAEDLIGRRASLRAESDGSIADGLSGLHEIGEGSGRHVVDCTVSEVQHNGAPAVQVIERDLTSQRHLERRMLRTFDISPNAMALISPAGLVQRVNGSMRDLFGLPGEIERSVFVDCLSYTHAEHVRGLMRRALETGRLVWIEYAYNPGEGPSRSIRWIATADPEDGSVTLGATDITGQREAERRLRDAERSRTIATMTGGLAHDLGNLFSAMSGHVHIASSHIDEDHPAHRAFEDICEVLAHAKELKESLQTLGGERLSLERVVDLCALVDDLMPLLDRLVQGRAELSCEHDATGPLTVRGDPARLKQVLVNLVVNARDAFHKGHKGAIDVRCDAPTDGTVRLVVEDNGPGVQEEIADTIFEPFFTTRGRTSGTGLGLALCKAIVQAHGGSIDVDVATSGGARFVVVLPATSERVSDADDERQALEHVVVGLDYPDGQERDIIEGMLERMGARVSRDDEGVRVVLRSGVRGDAHERRVPEVVVLDAGVMIDRDRAVALPRPFGRDGLERAIVRALKEEGEG